MQLTIKAVETNFTHLFFSLTDQVTIYFLTALSNGTKNKIYGKDVRHISIPHYEGLSLKCIAEFCNQYEYVGDYLPDGKELEKVPR